MLKPKRGPSPFLPAAAKPGSPAKDAPVGPNEGATRLQGLALVAAGVLVYSPALRGDWLWDDDQYILHNDAVQNPSGLWQVLTAPDGLGNYDPLTSVVRWAQWQLWGDNPLGYHLTSLALHLAGAFLIWRLFSRLRIACAWLGALLFALHPIMVESVAWIAELKNTLSLPPLLLAMLALLDFDDEGRHRKDYGRAAGWFLVSMLAKTAGLMLPVIYLGYVVWKRGRLTRGDWRAMVPFVAIALAAGLVSVLPHHDAIHHPDIIAHGGWSARLATLGWVGLFLLGKTLFPIGLLPAYAGSTVDIPSVLDLLPWLLAVGTVGLCWRARATWSRPLLAGGGFFFVNLVPVFGFVVFNYATMVWSMDHLVYLPVIGFCGLFAHCVGVLLRRPNLRAVTIPIVSLFVAAMALSARFYAQVFVNELSLWHYAVAHEPGYYLAQQNLGKAYLAADDPASARPHLEKVLQLRPALPSGHADLGNALVSLGELDNGIGHLRRSLELDPTNAEVENNLGVALVQQQHPGEAILHLQQALRLKTDYAIAYENLGGALSLAGRNPEAADSFAHALALKPDSPDLHDNLGVVLQKLGRNDDAAREFRRALELRPDDKKAQERLGQLQGKPGPAVK